METDVVSLPANMPDNFRIERLVPNISVFNHSILQQYNIFADYINIYGSLSWITTKLVPCVPHIIGIPANLIIMIYVIRSRKYKSPTFVAIASLALCDVLSCFAAVFWAIFIFPVILYPEVGYLCGIISSVLTMVVCTSIFHAVFFSVLRFVQLSYPLKSRVIITPRLILMICIAMWVVNVVPSFVIGMMYKPLNVNDVYLCEFVGDYKIKDTVATIIYNVLPVVVMAFFHILKHFVVKFRHQSKELTSSTTGETTNGRALSVIVLLAAVTNFPGSAHDFIHYFFAYPYKPYHHILTIGGLYLLVWNAAFDPFAYFLLCRKIRKDIQRMLCCASNHR